jgi:hypothetical protein
LFSQVNQLKNKKGKKYFKILQKTFWNTANSSAMLEDGWFPVTLKLVILSAGDGRFKPAATAV